MIRHFGAEFQGVDVAKNEVSHVLDLFKADIAPQKHIAPRDVPTKHAVIAIEIQSSIELPWKSADPRIASVDVLAAVVVIRHGGGVFPEHRPEGLDPNAGFFSRGSMGGDIVESDFEALVLQPKAKLKVLGISAGFSPNPTFAGLPDGPDTLGGTEPQVL